MRKSRFYTWLIVGIPLLALAIAVCIFMVRYARTAVERLPELVSSAVTESINGNVSIGAVDVYATGVVARDVTVTPRDGMAPVARIPRLIIRTDVRGILWKRKDPLKSMRSIEIQDPEFYLERGVDGRWNVSTLLKPSPEKKPIEWRGKVNISSARLIVFDRKVHPSVRNTFEDVHLSVDLAKAPVATYSISGKGTSGRLGKFTAKGVYDLDAQKFTADLGFRGMDMPFWTAYPVSLNLDIPSGSADGRAVLSGSADGKLSYAAALDVRDAAFKLGFLREPIRGINGRVDVRDSVIGLRVDGKLGGSAISCKGYILDPSNPSLSLELQSDSANSMQLAEIAGLGNALKDVRAQGAARVSVRVFGKLHSPRIKFSAVLPQVDYGPYRGTSVSAEGVYADGRIVVSRASLDAYGGSAEGRGSIDLTNGVSIELEGELKGVDIGRLPPLQGQKVSGAADADFRLAWQPGRPEITYSGSMRRCRVDRLDLDEVLVSGSFRENTVRISEMSGRVLGGLAAVSGELAADGAVRLQVAGSDINLAAVASLFTDDAVVGRGQFAGEISGDLESPVFEGRVEAYRLVVAGLGLERVVADLKASPQNLELSQLVAYDYPGTVTIAGNVESPFDGEPVIKLQVDVDNVDLDRLLASVGLQDDTGGIVRGRFAVSGTPKEPVAEGELSVKGALIGDVPIDEFQAQLAYRFGDVRVDGLEARSGSAVLKASGTVTRDEQLDAKITVENVLMDRLPPVIGQYVTARGSLRAEAGVSGSLQSPRATAEITCDNPQINGQKFKRLQARAQWDGKVVTVADAGLVDDQAEYLVTEASYNADSRELNFAANMENGSGRKLFALLDSSPQAKRSIEGKNVLQDILDKFKQPVSGTINAGISGRLDLSEEKPTPILQVSLKAEDVQVGKSTVHLVEIDGSYSDGVVRLAKLEVLDGDTNISVDGAYGPGRAVDLRLDAHGVSMDTLRQWIDIPDNFSGLADVTIVASGATDAPNSDIAVEIIDPVLAGVKFDRLRSTLSSRAVRTGGNGGVRGGIDVDDLVLVLDDRELRASGFIPVDWEGFKIPGDGAIYLESKLDSGSLALLSEFTGLKVDSDPGGGFGGVVKLEGTVSDPNLEGMLTWNKGRITPPKLREEIRNIEARIVLRDDKLSVESMTGESSEGGKFKVSGSISLADMKPVMDLSVITDKLVLSGKDISGKYGEDVKAVIDSDIRITGGFQEPLVSGTASVPDGYLLMSGKSVAPAKLVSSKLNPRFDLNVHIGRGVQFRSGRLKTPLYGSISLNGSLSQPVAEGILDPSGGTIQFPLRQLKISPGSSIAVRIGPQQPTVVFVDMKAQGRIPYVNSLGKQRTYKVTMTARGPLDNMESSFTTSPPGLSEETVFAMLTGQHEILQAFSNGGGADLSVLLTTAVAPTIFEPVGRVFRDWLGLEEFGLQMGYDEPIRLTVGDHLWDGFYVDYTRLLGARQDYSDSQEELRLSYRFKRGLELGVTAGDNNSLTFGLEGKLRF